MVNTVPEIPDGGRYSTTQAAKILGVNKSTIYRWRTSGALRCGIRRCNGRVFFEGFELKRLWKLNY